MSIARSAFLMVLVCYCNTFVVAAEDEVLKAFDSDSFSFQEPTFASSRWSSDIGGGASIPLNVNTTFPPISAAFFTRNSILFIISQPIQKPLQYSYEVEATVSRRMTDWMSLGGQVTYSIGHGIDIAQSDIAGPSGIGPNGIWGILTSDNASTFSFDYSLNVLSFMPLIKMGPRLMTDEAGWRPYVLFGLGGDYVTQTVHVNFDGATFNVYSKEDVYGSGTAGGGLAWKNDHLSISGEARYETVFKPGNPLRFLIPMARITYAF